MPSTRDDAERDLGHLFQPLREGMLAGVRSYYGPQSKYTDTAVHHRPTTKRSIVFDHVTHNLTSRLDGASGVKIRHGKQTTRYLVGGKWVISVHKADRGMAVGLNKTKQSM